MTLLGILAKALAFGCIVRFEKFGRSSTKITMRKEVEGRRIICTDLFVNTSHEMDIVRKISDVFNEVKRYEENPANG